MVAVTLAARGIGFLREAVIANGFGASREIDLFLIALTIPAIITTTVYYSIPNALVPLWHPGRLSQRHTSRAALGLVIAAVILGLFVWLLAVPASRLLASGFDSDLQLRTAAILRVGSATVVFAVVEAILRSRLLAAKRFALTGISYIWQSIGVIAAVLWWREYGAMGLMWGVLVGMCLSVLWNTFLLYFSGPDNTSTIGSSTNLIKEHRIWFWVAIVLLTDSFAQLYAVVDRYWGSYLEPGAITTLNFANLTAGLPSAIIGSALSTAILPFLSDAESNQDTSRADSIVDKSVCWTIVLALPVTIWLIAFRTEVAAVMFQRGEFDHNALRMTSSALAAAAYGILPVSLTAVWSRLFYSTRLWLPITLAAISALTAKTALSAIFVLPLGGTGLALSTSGAYLVGALLTGYMQRDRLLPNIANWGRVAGKTLLLIGVPTIAGHYVIARLGTEQLMVRNLIAAVSILVGVVLLVFLGRHWGIAQMANLLEFVLPRRAR